MNPQIRLNLRLPAVVTILVSMLSVGAFGSAPSLLEATLQSKYVGKAFTLRGFYADDHLHFDSNGNPLGKVHTGSWTTSLIAVKHVEVSSDKVELKGSRGAELYDSKQSKFVPVRTKLDVTLTLDRDASAQSDAAALSAVEHIFLGASDQLLDVVPDYWKALLAGAWETVPQENGRECYRIKGALERTAGGDLVMACEEDAKVKSPLPPKMSVDISSLPYYSKINGEVAPPRPLFDPSPEYSDLAHSLKFQGTTLLQLTVTPAGTPADIAIVMPIGCGVDEQAVKAVRTWKFQPAMLNGVPVPARIEVEVSFHMW